MRLGKLLGVECITVIITILAFAICFFAHINVTEQEHMFDKVFSMGMAMFFTIWVSLFTAVILIREVKLNADFAICSLFGLVTMGLVLAMFTHSHIHYGNIAMFFPIIMIFGYIVYMAIRSAWRLAKENNLPKTVTLISIIAVAPIVFSAVLLIVL